jgi:hypothetical protein
MPEIQRTLPLDPGRDLLRLDFWRSSPRERPLSARCDDGPSRIAFDRVGTSGGVPCDCGSSQHTTPPITKEQLTRALGQAVIRIWSNLPQDVQDHLFKEAVASQGESIRSQLAVFLHDKHSRTADPLGNPREMKEQPDSLGAARSPCRKAKRIMVASRGGEGAITEAGLTH